MLESRSRFLFVILIISILISVYITYWNTMVQKDFVIINDVEEEEGISEDTGSEE